MTDFASALYVGEVTHVRLRPRRHHLRYRLYSLLVDVDELPALARASRLFSHNSFNVFSIHDRDFGDGAGGALRDQVERHLSAAGLPTGGPIRLFAMPRVLGYVFNPISIFFCHHRDGALSAILYEVHNTFGERHCYLIPVAAGDQATVRQDCDKGFHVSPFMDMRMKYQFRVKPPADTIRIGIIGGDDDGVLITANQVAERVAFSDRALAKVFMTYPLVTLKVVGAIHWEALRLWMKGVRVRSKPPEPRHFVTTIHPDSVP